jgi:hypothetical protein
MSKDWIVGAQLSTTHSSPDRLGVDHVLSVIERVRSVLDLDILIVGDREIPETFRLVTNPRGRPAKQIFLWYNVLSDIAGMADSDLVVNWRGQRSRGWGGWAEKRAEVAETFRFACPNNPAARAKTLTRLRELLTRYSFDGVFLDKIRFPSPANGLEEVVSCFCDHCRHAAAAIDLDLGDVARVFERGLATFETSRSEDRQAEGASWLEILAGTDSLLSRFLRFRSDSIEKLVAQAHAEASRLGRKVSIDLFSPGLAPLVGQDYGGLARYCEWVKPMTYRVAEGPAGLRLEIPALAEGAARMLGLSEASILVWASRHLPGFEADTLRLTREHAVPMPVIIPEIAAAVRLAHPVPVLFGLELVCHPGVIEITPEQVIDMVRAGREANADGAILSWDLMHAPMDGVRALAAAV